MSQTPRAVGRARTADQRVELFLVYGVALLIAVLFSEWSDRTVLSSAVMFLVIGFVVGPGAFGWVAVPIDAPVVTRLSQLALFAILFSDGLKLGIGDLRAAWRLPGRALLIGLPLTMAGIAIASRLLIGLPWGSAFLIGAILSPTDPVFAAAVVGRPEIPQRVRHLLNVESGLNDGLALPVVMTLLAVTSGTASSPLRTIAEAAAGLALGAVIAVAAGLLRALPFLRVSTGYAPLFPFAVGILVLSLASTVGANEYLAAFAAGMTLASVNDRAGREFQGLAEPVNELLKLAAVLIFAIAMSGHLSDVPWTAYAFAAVVLTFVRTAAIRIALLGCGLTRAERLVAEWFGPKGFASIVYGLMLLRSHTAQATELFQLIALVIVISIVLHSSTDVPVARYFRAHEIPNLA